MNTTRRIIWPRLILMIGAVACATTIFAWIYGNTVRQSAVEAARVEAERRAALEIGTLVSDVEKFRLLPFALVELPDVRAVLTTGTPDDRARLDTKLNMLAAQTEASVIYVTNQAGIALSSSNAGQSDSFVGHSFQFRPYFIRAMREGADEYFAEGSVTRRTGLFLARRVGGGASPAGIVVVKIEFQKVEQLWRAGNRISFITDRDGVIILSTEPRIRFTATAPIAPSRRAEIVDTRQFGNAPPAPSGIRFMADGTARDASGRHYLAIVRDVPLLGWRHIHLEPLQPVLDAASARIRLATLLFALVAIALGSFLLWRVTRHRRQQQAQEMLEAQVVLRTAELSRVNARLQEEAAERERADSLYRAAREELAQANRLGSIGTITTSVAHELNQPVAAIRTAAENGRKFLSRGNEAQVNDNLSLIVDLTMRIGSITGELLRYGRRGRRGTRIVPLEEVIDGARMLIGDSFRRAGVTLEISREAPLPMVRVSRIRAEQIIVNLLQNALDATAGRKDAHVLLTASARSGHAEIIVADNGPGIPAALADDIFQPFVTGKPEGTGLGLGISREIAGEYGGILELVESPLGGAAFRVLIPSAENGQ